MLILILWGLVGCNTQPKNNKSMDYKAVADSLIDKTFDTLSSTLVQAMAAGGPEYAINVCQVKAPEITGLYGTADIKITRTALRVRNAANKPNAEERAILEKYLQLAEKGDSLKPILVQTDDGMHHYYKPILLKPICLSCHGMPDKDIAAATLKALSSKYPLDMATGFTIGSLRGMWHVQFSK